MSPYLVFLAVVDLIYIFCVSLVTVIQTVGYNLGAHGMNNINFKHALVYNKEKKKLGESLSR